MTAPASDSPAGSIYGVLTAEGLKGVERAARRAVGHDGVSVYHSAFDGGDTIKIRTDRVDFETTYLGGDEFLFNGVVVGSPEDVKAFVRHLSAALEAEGIGHTFEVYGGKGELLLLVPTPK